MKTETKINKYLVDEKSNKMKSTLKMLQKRLQELKAIEKMNDTGSFYTILSNMKSEINSIMLKWLI